MSKEWGRFLSALEAKGIAFDQVRLASDRQAVIRAAGLTDPLSIAMVETAWARQTVAVGSSGFTGHTTATTAGAGEEAAHPRSTAPSVRAGGEGLRVSLGAEGVVMPTMDDPSRLAGLPEEIQDSVVASAVLAAALGFGGSLLVFHPAHADANAAVASATSSSVGPAGGFSVSSYVPASMRGLCQTVLPVADAFVAIRGIEEAEYLGRSLVGMALGETVSEIATSYAHQITKLQRWSRERTTPLMGVVSEILRVGHHIVRLRQVLPMDLLLVDNQRSRLSAADGHSGSSAAADGASGGIRGPRILNYLTDQAERCAGSREDSELVSLLLRRALVPYLRVLHRWMHEGVLDDPFGEFFITECSEPSSRQVPTALVNAQRRSASQLFPDAALLLAHEGVGVNGGTGPRGLEGSRFPSALSLDGQQARRQQDVLSFERRFSMNKLMIPSFLERPGRIAKMIFLAGRYRCLLREYNDTRPAFGEAAEGLLIWSGADALHRRVQASYDITSQAVLQLLFSPSVDLVGHLRSMKRYFLHERGDWVVDFLDSAEELLRGAPDRVRAHPMRVLLQAAIARSCATSDPYHALVSCSFAEDGLVEHFARLASGVSGGSEGASAAYTGRRAGATRIDTHRCLELVQLDVDLQWPLTLVLDAAVVARLNGIFRLLTAVKACERALGSLWYRNEVLASFSVAYSMKHQLTHILRQFLFYSTHFVLEPLWSRLETRIAQADAVFAVSTALSDFLTSAETGLVLSSPSRLRSLTAILSLSTRFCDVGMHASSATMSLIEATLQSMQEELLRALTELASPTGEDYPQLIPLLTWIDFSSFYDRNDVYHVQCGISS